MAPIADARTRRPEVRIAHLGLGHFHRAHQVWYTQHADESEATDAGAPAGWGIAAFTGRSPRAAEALAAQDGVYTLITRAADGDAAQIMQSLVRAHDGAGPEWERTLADPRVAVLTVTVTERGYGDSRSAGTHSAETAGERIARGLSARARSSAGPIALVSCDNVSGNGEALRTTVLGATDDAGLRAWIESNVSFVSTMVDRITPGTTQADLATAVELTGYDDAVPVVTEPFREWVLCGEFPAGRPAWERAGACFVDDVEPYERRKLWLLNAGHSLLAAVGIPRGHETVAGAFADHECRMLLEGLWAEARELLPFDDETTDAFLSDLRARFANPRIAHRLSQIDDGSLQKLGQRQAAIIRARLDAGAAPGAASLATIEAWGAVRGLDLPEALDSIAPGLARRVHPG
jgi:fructuronate reductase